MELNQIKKEFPEIINEVRGVGFFIGIKLVVDQSKFIKKLMERRKKNIEFKKEFKKKTGVDLNDVHIHGDGPPG